jgi:hypothetical protein
MDKKELGRTVGTPGAVIEVRFTREEILALNRLAQRVGIGPVEYTRQTMVRHIREAGSPSTPERLAYWYFRLNGFMTIENFLVHPEFGSNPRTDVDILATRFRYRQENVAQSMIDDPLIVKCETFANIIIAEIKTSFCRLNGPWRNPASENMERVLRSIGCCVTEEEVSAAAQSLYNDGKWSNDMATVRLFVMGERKNNDLEIDPRQQIEWSSVIDFCVRRFKTYEEQKASNSQWSPDGIRLRELALVNDIESIRNYFGLNPPEAAL